MRMTKGRWGARGFTLVELLIVVAMVGVLAALAVVSYKKYLSRAETGEAKAVLGAIRNAQKFVYASQGVYLSCSASYGGADYFPQASPPTHARWSLVIPDVAIDATSVCWRRLHIVHDQPVYFGYTTIAGAPGSAPPAVPAAWGAEAPIFPVAPLEPWFVMHAAGDRDEDNTLAFFAGSSFEKDKLYSHNEEE